MQRYTDIIRGSSILQIHTRPGRGYLRPEYVDTYAIQDSPTIRHGSIVIQGVGRFITYVIDLALRIRDEMAFDITKIRTNMSVKVSNLSLIHI